MGGTIWGVRSQVINRLLMWQYDAAWAGVEAAIV